MVGPLDLADENFGSAQFLFEQGFEIGARPRPAAEDVKAQRSKLGEGMASKVRFGQQTYAGDAARQWELMPTRFIERMQLQFADQSGKQVL